MLNWLYLTESTQLDKIIEDSVNQKVIIFKHSTRCSISIMVKERLERNWTDALSTYPIYYLDLLQFRNISNEIAEKTNIEHQSPQVLVLENKVCIYHANHNSINASNLADALV